MVVDLAGCEFCGPTDEEGDADAAFVERAFHGAEGRVVGSAGRVAAVVAEEEDEGIVALTGVGQGGGDETDGVVEETELCEVFAALRVRDAGEFFEAIGRGFVWGVRGVEWEVEHPWMVFVGADEGGGGVAEGEREVRGDVGDGFAVADEWERVLAFIRQPVGEAVTAADEAEGFVEAAGPWDEGGG